MGQHQEQRSFRRLLENFQDCVGSIAIEVIGGIDDDDPPIAGPRRLREEFAGPPHLVDGDGALDLAGLVVDWPCQMYKIV